MNNLKEIILGRLPINWRDRLATVKRYSIAGHWGAPGPTAFFLCDGTTWHGGLCDRFKGIVSLYALCKARKWNFRIDYSFPFRLEDFLEPNSYIWTAGKGEKSGNTLHVKMMRLIGDPSAKRLIHSGQQKQLHIYANRDIVDEINEKYNKTYQWGRLFRELFKPTQRLHDIIEEHKQKIGGEYVAAAFRMQNIFGDFKEYEYEAMAKEEQDEITEKCIEAIKTIISEEEKTVVVTSDSAAFLNKMAEIDGVYPILGKSSHPDTKDTGITSEEFLKSFVDFYMLAGAEKVFAPATDEMYKSAFPEMAARLHDIPFERIWL
ncbi:MAG: hypothetical protein J6U33_04320 [Paludibacteraceae bacterium]|nr:hypothetical protein [Paludibacteraceae bacterium]